MNVHTHIYEMSAIVCSFLTTYSVCRYYTHGPKYVAQLGLLPYPAVTSRRVGYWPRADGNSPSTHDVLTTWDNLALYNTFFNRLISAADVLQVSTITLAKQCTCCCSQL